MGPRSEEFVTGGLVKLLEPATIEIWRPAIVRTGYEQVWVLEAKDRELLVRHGQDYPSHENEIDALFLHLTSTYNCPVENEVPSADQETTYPET